MVFKIVSRGRLWGNFLLGGGSLKGVVFCPFELFSKLKTTCKYDATVKVKISMTCVYKEGEIKIKMVQHKRVQLKMKF